MTRDGDATARREMRAWKHGADTDARLAAAGEPVGYRDLPGLAPSALTPEAARQMADLLDDPDTPRATGADLPMADAATLARRAEVRLPVAAGG